MNTNNILLPAVWLLVLLVGLPQLSETVYTPSLPDIAHALRVSDSMAEYTLTIYLGGFAVGTLFWGKLSDKHGRKPCVLAGLLIFIGGCISCYCANTISLLMISRFIQAFGGSIGSVLGQAICRDAFNGPARGKIYATIGSALAVFPAIGPVVGGIISEYYGWRAIFLFLTLLAAALSLLVVYRLPETHHAEKRRSISMLEVSLRLLKDKKVIGFILIISACLGMSFSYFAEGSFFLIKVLGLSPTEYGFSFMATAFCSMIGGLASKHLHNRYTSRKIMAYGLIIIASSSVAFCALIILHESLVHFSANIIIAGTILSRMVAMFGNAMTVSNVLALALEDYQWCVGTASSLFGFFYYFLVSLCTLGMGALHNGTLLPMPLYFLALSILMLIVQRATIR